MAEKGAGHASGKSWKELQAESAVTPEEQRLLDEAEKVHAEVADKVAGVLPVPDNADPANPEIGEGSDELPDWVKVPSGEGFRFPKNKRVFFIRIKAEWCDAINKGDRVVICWTLTDAEENMAVKRALGDSTRTYKEMSKLMIRAIDGAKTDWSGNPGPGNIARFWDEIGPVGRNLLINVFHKTHGPKASDIFDFFRSCFVSRSAVAG